MERRGRKRAYDPQGIRAALDEFIEFCEETDTLPTDWELCKRLKLAESTLYRMRTAEGAYKDFKGAFDRLKNFRESFYLAKALAAKNPSAAIFALKQPCNGGWTDAQKIDQSINVKVDLSGVGADAFG